MKAQLYGGKKYTPPLPGQRLLLIGDPASAPAIGDALDRAPASCDVEVVLLAGADAWVPLGEHRATLTRVPVSAGDEALMRHLRETLARGVPDWAWVALESTPTRRRPGAHSWTPVSPSPPSSPRPTDPRAVDGAAE